jgi:hypothetical protein
LLPAAPRRRRPNRYRYAGFAPGAHPLSTGSKAVPGAIAGEAPHALSATDTPTTARPKTIPRRGARQLSAARVRAATFVAMRPDIVAAAVDR